MKDAKVDYMVVRQATDKAAQSIEASDLQGLIQVLDSYHKVKVTDMVDEKGYSLLHTACFKNHEDICVKVMENVYQNESPERMKEWINMKTD